jgi:membrane glycosyltransferase
MPFQSSGRCRPVNSGPSFDVPEVAGRAASRAGILMPRVRRVSMAPRKLERNPWRVLWNRLRCNRKSSESDRVIVANGCAQWRGLARRRRICLVLFVLAQTAVACWSLARTFPLPDLSYLQMAIVSMFAVLFAWISFSFWANVAGFWMLLRKTKLTDNFIDTREDRPLLGRTAIVMPICDENVGRCFAGIEAMYRSLRETGQINKFTFYVLSDTSSRERQVEEELAWAETCRAVRGFCKIHYRRRRVNIKRKSGNIADFLRRWSRDYDYMIVLDADSVMTGAALHRLAQMMEAAPQTGIIQTTPTIVNSDSLFGRMQQFASRAYGPLFSASLHFWQLGESYYWGHNAIIRIEPFLKHCALARLPGRAPLGGEILSHDFVEAALMGRAGWEVWLALDLPGSYEEAPPTLLDELKRDRRWCQGNLQHLRLLFAEGIKTGHRAIFAMGVMAYVSALFWAVFLALNTIHLAYQSIVTPDYFSSQPSLFPIWPQWNPEWAIALASTTALLLFLPKLFSFFLIVKNNHAKYFGGIGSLGASIVCEIILSTLLAPLRMWFHCKFVLLTLTGRPIKWNAQQRAASCTRWVEAIRAHAFATTIAGGFLAAIGWFDPGLLIWILPVAVPLLFSIPLSVCFGSVHLGRASYRCGLFRIPEQASPPAILDELRTVMEKEKQSKLTSDEVHVLLSDAFMHPPRKDHPVAKSVAYSA